MIFFRREKLIFQGALYRSIIVSLKDKRKVLNIVRNQKDPQKREEAIRDMAEIYDAIENDVLPKLRKATITLRVYEPKKTEEDIVSLSIEDPSQLDIKEMLFAACHEKTILHCIFKKLFFFFSSAQYRNVSNV